MAFPTIPTAGANTLLFAQTATAGTTHTSPSLTTLDNASGDLLVWIVVLYQPSATGNTFGSWGGSFTEFGDSSSATNPSIAMGAAYKISDGTETGTITVISSIAGRAAMCLMAIKDWHGTTPPEIAFSGATTATAQDPPNLDPTGWDAEDTLWIAVAGGGQTSLSGSWGGITSAPANYTDYAEGAISGGDAIGACQIAVAFRGLNATAENPGAFTTDTSPEIERAATIAIRPASAAYSQPIDETASTITDASSRAIGKRARSAAGEPITVGDAPLITTPTGVRARRMDLGHVRLAPGAAELTAGYTKAFLVNLASFQSGPWLDFGFTWDGVVQTRSHLGSNRRVAVIGNSGGGAVTRTSPTTINNPSGWVLVAISKPAGDAGVPRVHILQPGAAWVHENTDGPVDDADVTIAGGDLGSNGGIWLGFVFLSASIQVWAAVAMWTSDLTDGQIESLDGGAITDWLALDPAACWKFDQTGDSDAIPDLTGNGADSISVTGSSVVDYGPAGFDYGIPQTIADGATVTDAIDPQLLGAAWEQPIDDSIAITDAQTASFAKAVADSLAGTDAILKTLHPSVIGDAAAITDGLAMIRAFSRTFADTVAATDSLTVSSGLAVHVDDAITAADEFTRTATFVRPIGDTAALSDAHGSSLTRSIADSITGTDSASTVWAAVVSVTDSLLGTDAQDFATTGTQTKSVTDSASIADEVTVQVDFERTVADAASATDALAKRLPTVQIGDLIAGADALDRAWAAKLALSDSGLLSDLASVGAGEHWALNVDDGIVAGDQVGRAAAYVRTADDAAGVADEIAKGAGLRLVELVTGTDEASRVVSFTRAVADGLRVTDHVTPLYVPLHRLTELRVSERQRSGAVVSETGPTARVSERAS